MGSFISKNKQEEEAETPGKEGIVKRIEDPRSPTEEINRTPIEVEDKVLKNNIRHLAHSNALKQQNRAFSDTSPRCRTFENGFRKPKFPFTKTLESTPILYHEESNLSLDVSAIEKENIH